jgi:hypothetical protein
MHAEIFGEMKNALKVIVENLKENENLLTYV